MHREVWGGFDEGGEPAERVYFAAEDSRLDVPQVRRTRVLGEGHLVEGRDEECHGRSAELLVDRLLPGEVQRVRFAFVHEHRHAVRAASVEPAEEALGGHAVYRTSFAYPHSGDPVE